MRIGILAAVCLGQDKFNLAVECIKRFEGWHGERKHWPYVGWGHNYPNLNIILTLYCK